MSGPRLLSTRLVGWAVIFVTCNVVGVETFKAAVTLPSSEALLPRLFTVCLVGVAALAATQIQAALRAPRSK